MMQRKEGKRGGGMFHLLVSNATIIVLCINFVWIDKEEDGKS